VADFKKGVAPGSDEPEAVETKVDLPVDAHLPHDYVPSERLRLEAYRRVAGAQDEGSLVAAREELVDRYGALPEPVERLFAVASFRLHAKRFGLREVSAQGNYVRFAPLTLRESQTLRLQRLYPRSVVKATVSTVLVPRPTTARVGGQPLRDTALLDWARQLLDGVLGDDLAAAAATATSSP
jgi:transcription-repair coupling factor (superfamily II helicase)